MKKITIILLLFANTLFAQWTTDTTVNTLVAASGTDDAKAIGTADGKTYVVFWKVVPGPVNYELRAQLLDADGQQLFGTDGMLVSDAIPMSTSTVVWKLAVDAADNLYISVTGTGAGTPAIVFKMDTSGSLSWGSSGVTVGSGYVPTVLPLSGGDVMVSYMPTSGKAKLQRYTAAGVAEWGTATDIVGANAAAGTVPADMFELSDGSVTMVFHQRFSFGVGSNLFAQRYSADGVALWAAPAQLSNKGTAYNAQYGGVQDGDVIYYGYSGATGLRYDGFVQRVNPDGALPWGINGSDFDVAQADYELDTKIAFEPGDGAVWAIARYTPSTQDLYGEYVQKFDKGSGARLLGENAHQVFAVDNNYRNHSGDLQLVNNGPLFLVKQGLDNGASPVTLSAVLLDPDGNPLFNPQLLPVATFPASKGRVALTRPVNGQAVAVFTEQKAAGGNRAYAQRIADALLRTKTLASPALDLQVYPNPSSGLVNFSFGANTPDTVVTVFAVTGQFICSFHLGTNGTSQHFPPGFYLLKTTDGISKKFIVL